MAIKSRTRENDVKVVTKVWEHVMTVNASNNYSQVSHQ
jgi:hypothetical protein